MSKKINLKIITPEKILLEKPVDAVYSMATDGEFGILPGHISFVTPLKIGVTKFIEGENAEFVTTMGGLLEVKNDEVLILSNTAELGEEIDIARAKTAKERAEARLGAAKADTDVERAQLALTRAVTRIKAASKNN